MASDLIIGPLDPETEKHLLKICKRIGLKGWPASGGRSSWLSRLFKPVVQPARGENIMISVLNVASVDAFNTYAASLEGFSDTSAMVKTKWDELARIREVSSIDIATLPPAYENMRKDYRSWFSANGRLSEDDTARWVWNALQEGAQISIENQIPMLLAI